MPCHITPLPLRFQSDITLLFSSLSFFLDVPNLLNLETKRLWLSAMLREMYPSAYGGAAGGRHQSQRRFRLALTRGGAPGLNFLQAVAALNEATPVPLRAGVAATFEGEPGVGPGVTREAFDVLVRDATAGPPAILEVAPNGQSFDVVASQHGIPADQRLASYRALGTLMGLAIFHRILFGVRLTRVLATMVLGREVTWRDFAHLDETQVASLEYLLDHDGAEDLTLFFEVADRTTGGASTIELVPGGSNIPGSPVCVFWGLGGGGFLCLTVLCWFCL